MAGSVTLRYSFWSDGESSQWAVFDARIASISAVPGEKLFSQIIRVLRAEVGFRETRLKLNLMERSEILRSSDRCDIILTRITAKQIT